MHIYGENLMLKKLKKISAFLVFSSLIFLNVSPVFAATNFSPNQTIDPVAADPSCTPSTCFVVSSSTSSTYPGTATFTLATITNGTSTNFFATLLNAVTLTLSNALGILYGGTGTSTPPSYGQILVGNQTGGYDYVSTTSLAISASGTVNFANTANTAATSSFSSSTAIGAIVIGSTPPVMVSFFVFGL
jgi:hypothetical protein